MYASGCRSLRSTGRRALSGFVLVPLAFFGACDASTSSVSVTTAPPSRSSLATSPSATGSATPSPRPTDADQLLDDARGALFEDSSAFHVSGYLTSVEVSVDFAYGPHDLAIGTVTERGGGVLKVRQLADGTLYANGDSAWFAEAGADRTLSAIAGRWVVVPPKNPPTALLLAQIADRGLLYNGVVAVAPDIQGTITGPKAVDGVDSYVITDGADTYAVAAHGPPRPIEYTTDHGGQHLRFDHYDAAVSVHAPPASQVVALRRP